MAKKYRGREFEGAANSPALRRLVAGIFAMMPHYDVDLSYLDPIRRNVALTTERIVSPSIGSPSASRSDMTE